MGNKKKKWYQTGEFEDGYQIGDVFRTIKNSVSGKKENKTEKNKTVKKSNNTTSTAAPVGAVKNGRLVMDPAAQLYGFENEDERQRYIKENPELYASMGGYKYVPTGTPLRNTESITNSNKSIDKTIERFKNTDTNKVQEAIRIAGSGEWQDADTMKKHTDTLNRYVNDFVTLEKLGYFDSLPEDKRKGYVEILRSIKNDINRKNTLHSTFNSIYNYNAYIMNNTTEQDGGMSIDSISARKKAYGENALRMKEIENILDKTSSSKVVTEDGLKGWLMKITKDYDDVNTKKLIDEYEFLQEQNRLYERFNKENDSLVLQFANNPDFESNSKYIFQSSSNTEYGAFNPDNYKTFLEYYSIGTDALVHSKRVQNGEEIDDYWYTAQSRGWDYAKVNEFKMLNYLANTQGDEAAQNYYDALSKELSKRRYMVQEEKWNENYKNAEWYEKIGLNILSVPEKIYGTAVDAIEDIGNLVTGQEYDSYAAHRKLTNHSNNTRKNTALEIDELTDGKEFLGVSWGDAYQAAMSGIDSISGVATFGGKIYPIIAGMGASSAKAKELYEQGASNMQIAAASIFAGVAEMTFENISTGKFLDEFVNAPAKKWYQLLGKAAVQGGIEMSEEMATELSNIITDTVVLGSRSEWEKLIQSYKQKGYSDCDAFINAMWDKGGDILEAGICGFISGGTMGGGGAAINHLSNQIQNSTKTYISFEEFSNIKSSIWNNVDYLDEITKLGIMQKTHNAMVQNGAVVKVSQETLENVAEAYPDLRAVKKKERAPILKESMNNLKENVRQFLNKFKNRDFEFEVNGKILEARLYNTGINEVLEKITQEKANMLYSTENIFKNSRYLYSTTDYDGDPNIYRWNYFYTPVQIGENIVGVRIAVRDIATPQGSQIYNWNIKRDASLDDEGRGINDRISHGVSSNASNYNIPKTQEKVNNIQKEAISRDGVASFVDEHFEKSTPKINPDEVVDGLWDGAPNTNKNIVEKSRLESVENIDESGIIEKTVDNDTGIPGEYTEEIVWSIFHYPVRRCGKGYFGKRTKQSDLRVDNYELKINPNNESYYLQHPDGRYVQFENMKNSTVQDAKLAKSKRSLYYAEKLSSYMKQKLINKANRQLETSNAAGYKLEWIVSDQVAAEQLTQFFAEQNMDIIVTYCPE